MIFKKLSSFLLIICGNVGTGKTHLARHLAKKTGFVYLNSDLIRKKTFNLPPFKHQKRGFNQGIYNLKITERIYKKLIKEASSLLLKNKPVILDATFTRKAFRNQVASLAKELKIPYCFVECVAPERIILQRLKQREKIREVSDADPAVFFKKGQEFEPIRIPPKHYLRINATSPIKIQRDRTLRKILSLISVPSKFDGGRGEIEWEGNSLLYSWFARSKCKQACTFPSLPRIKNVKNKKSQISVSGKIKN